MRKYLVLTRLIFLITVVVVVAGSRPVSATPRSCESLLQLALPNTKITTAQTVTTGEFTPTGRTAIKDLPAFCRVAATLSPSSDSDIKIEIWFPVEGWNGKYPWPGERRICWFHRVRCHGGRSQTWLCDGGY
jgi:feruloyl esterase